MLEWSFVTDEEIVRVSRCRVRQYKDLMSPAFGRAVESDSCMWCSFNRTCPGHWGHIVLPFPVRHPITHLETFVLAVPPLKLRPAPTFSTKQVHGLTKQYASILRCVTAERLQQTVNELYGHSTFSETLTDRFRGKQGRMRANIMGRRVNNSARSVITGDPYLNWWEVGVPHSIANTLTVHVRLTDLNRWAVEAKMFDAERADTLRFWLDARGVPLETVPLHAKVGDIFQRPLEDGDLVILNRQPTLHRNSMLGMEVKRMPHSTIRIHPRVTKGFNADFDGDEMNLFAVQTLAARAEVDSIMHIRHHASYVVDIQDSKLAAHLGLDRAGLRLFGHSVGWRAARRTVAVDRCSNTMNVHEFKNDVLRRVRDAEPAGSPWRRMIEAKSKGRWANLCAIKGCLGQQFIQGDIPEPLHAWEPNTRASRGFVHANYRDGLTPREFFFHCMAGREGLIDTAIRTADVGYKHRRIARFLEELRVAYDGTVRDERGNVVRFNHSEPAGTFVGLLAAQNIGEPATQLTLNTFHQAGSIAEITTSGLSRMQELLQWSKKNAHEMQRKRHEFEGEEWTIRGTTLETFTKQRVDAKLTTTVSEGAKRAKLTTTVSEGAKPFGDTVSGPEVCTSDVLTVRPLGARSGSTKVVQRVSLDVDMMLRYDTDIKHIHGIVGGIPHGTWVDPWIETDAPADTPITGRPGVTSASSRDGVIRASGVYAPWTAHEYSTNPRTTFKRLGIEAARAVWVSAMREVLPQVDATHIELLADYMCQEGRPTACARGAFTDKSTLRAAAYERAHIMFPRAAKLRVRERTRSTADIITMNQFSTLHMVSTDQRAC